jgi:hypothetical protein
VKIEGAPFCLPRPVSQDEPSEGNLPQFYTTVSGGVGRFHIAPGVVTERERAAGVCPYASQDEQAYCRRIDWVGRFAGRADRLLRVETHPAAAVSDCANGDVRRQRGVDLRNCYVSHEWKLVRTVVLTTDRMAQ